MRRLIDAFMQGYNESRQCERPPVGMWTVICDVLVWYAVFECVLTPVLALVRGNLWSYEAFIGGCMIVAAVKFGEVYFRGRTNAVQV